MNKHFSRVTVLNFTALVLISGFVMFGVSYVKAEQSGSTPESGSTSRIQMLYTDLTTAGSATNALVWGTYWDTIKTAAKWVPTGNAATGDVRSGKTFYNTTRTVQTGTALLQAPCSTQVNDDSTASGSMTNGCSVAWTVASPVVTGDDTNVAQTGNPTPGNKDPFTGLVWSQLLKNVTSAVAFNATTNSTWSWDASAANNIAVGTKTAKQLCSDRGNGWRLPSQKELMQAYIDGSYFNLSQPANYFWSATESSSAAAWGVNLSNGFTNYNGKTTAFQVRCVR